MLDNHPIQWGKGGKMYLDGLLECHLINKTWNDIYTSPKKHLKYQSLKNAILLNGVKSYHHIYLHRHPGCSLFSECAGFSVLEEGICYMCIGEESVTKY